MPPVGSGFKVLFGPAPPASACRWHPLPAGRTVTHARGTHPQPRLRHGSGEKKQADKHEVIGGPGHVQVYAGLNGYSLQAALTCSWPETAQLVSVRNTPAP